MIALGYDYGTTNSLIVRFNRDITSNSIRNSRRSERMPDGQSPKRLLNDRHADSSEIIARIEDFSKSMFGEVRDYLPDEKVVVTLTIPNTFRDVQCLQMRDAVARACCDHDVFGTNICSRDLHILPEPIAAALYYVYLAHDSVVSDKERYLVVYDVGGGTSDFAVIGYKIRNNSGGQKEISFSVKCTTGELVLGGDDFDKVVAEYMGQYLECNKGVCMTSEIDHAVHRDCEAVKCCVAARDYVHDLYLDDDAVCESLRLSRKVFENKMKNSGKYKLFKESAEQLRHAFEKKLAEAGVSFESALSSTVILPVGGSSKIPLLQETMQNVFEGCYVIDEDEFGESARFESVSRGAAIYSAWKAGMLNDIADIQIEERVLHRISYMWGNNLLHTCVEKNFPSGVYSIDLRPSGLQERADGSFVIGQVHFYEGEGDVVDQSDASYLRNEHLRTLAEELGALNDPIYLNGRKLSDIIVKMNLNIVGGRLHAVDFVVPKGRRDGSDYYSGSISIQ